MAAGEPRTFEIEGAGLVLVGDRWGEAPGRGIVLLLHGGGQTRHSWARTGARLAAAGYAARALDARGHGDSAWDPGGDYSLETFAADLLAVTATLPQPPVLVGASLGGITALLAAGQHPGLARGLVLVDVVIAVERAGVERIRAFMTAHLDGFASLEEASDAVAAYNPNRARPRSLDGLRKNLRLRSDGRWYWHWDPAFMHITDEPQRKIDPHQLQDAAAHIDIPTLLVRGEHSDVVSDAGLADMRRRIPGAEVVEIGGAGHMVAGDDNDVFAVRLEAFLAGLGDDGAG
jgi:pimeloyl-ACP methyl ester carboxylesterase